MGHVFADSRSRVCLLLALAVLASAGAPPVAGIEVVQRDHVVLRVRSLGVAPAPGTTGEPWEFDVDPDRGGSLSLELLWPDPGTRCRLRLSAVEQVPPAGAARLLELRAELVLADGTSVRASRPLPLDEAATALFEVYRLGDRSLTLAFEAETVTETELAAARPAGPPVRFDLEIQRVDRGRAVTLETNRLDTLVGEAVSYSFRLGEPGKADAVTLRLEPVRRFDELVKLELRVSGTLPAEGGTEVVSREEEWVVQRGATSTLAVEHGEPPSGYRFLVTARF
jgi:hypothetical protein